MYLLDVGYYRITQNNGQKWRIYIGRCYEKKPKKVIDVKNIRTKCGCVTKHILYTDEQYTILVRVRL